MNILNGVKLIDNKNMKTKEKNNIAFWIITVLCIVSLILSPILGYIKKSAALGGYIFGGTIILWLCMVILHETEKHK